jgi:hypothetical protein
MLYKNFLSCDAPKKLRTQQERPNLYIVGAPKSGTTALANYLAAHPDIYMAKKEMHFFGADLRFGRQFYRRKLDAYQAEFAARYGRRWAGEASVWYLFSTTAATEIRDFNPQSRAIIILREPVEMLHSLYCQFYFDGNECEPTFAAALAAEGERREGQRLGRRTYFAQGLMYRQVARYAEQVQRYFHILGRRQVLVLLYDDFAADPAATYRRTLDFLELDSPVVEPEFKIVNPAKCARSSLLRTVLSEPWVRGTAIALRRWLPARTFSALQRAEMRLLNFNARVVPRPALPPDLRARLRHEFAPEVQRLSDLLERDLGSWTSPQPADSNPRPAVPHYNDSPCPQTPQPLDAPALA